MLNESLERLSKIGSPKSIAFVARWLSENVTSVDTLKTYASSTAGIKNSEVEPILLLLESMDLIKIVDNTYIDGAGMLKEKYNLGEDSFRDWFIDKFIEFSLDNSIIDIDTISYSIVDNAFIMSATTIKPKQHACYRNILTDYEVITLLNDARYLVNTKLDKAIKAPKRHKKISEKQFLHKLEEQREQGERGEMFVLEYEKKRISNPALQGNIQRISIIDVSAGYDIVSYLSDESSKIDRFIEVKTYNGNEHFHWSKNEIDTARLMGDSYFLYLVDEDCIEKEDYEPTIICNPAKEILGSYKWKKTPDSFEIERSSGVEELISSSIVEGYKMKAAKPQYLSDIKDEDTSDDVIIELVQEAGKMDEMSVSVVEKLLGRLNDKHDGAYKEALSGIRRIADLKNGYRPAQTIVKHTHIHTFENYGSYNDNSVDGESPKMLE